MSVVLERNEEGTLRTIRLDRPGHRNALTGGMLDALSRAFEDLARDPPVGLVVLTASGGDFCTGLDLDEFYASASAETAVQERESARLGRLLELVVGCPVPTVSAVRGRALGFGATLALACDVTLVSSNAEVAFPEINFGFLPAFAARILLERVSAKGTFDLLATGRTVTSQELKVLGLASRVIPDEGFVAVSGSRLQAMAANAGPLIELKRLLLRLDRTSLTEGLRVSAQASTRARASALFRDAARQFAEMA